MDYTPGIYFLAYAAVAILSMFEPTLVQNYPRFAAIMQILAGFGMDLPRVAEGLRKLTTRAAGRVAVPSAAPPAALASPVAVPTAAPPVASTVTAAPPQPALPVVGADATATPKEGLR